MREDEIQELGDEFLNLQMLCKTVSAMEHWLIRKVTHLFLVTERSIGKKLEIWVSYFLKLRLQRSKPEYFTSHPLLSHIKKLRGQVDPSQISDTGGSGGQCSRML
jgi:hypothetical protein